MVSPVWVGCLLGQVALGSQRGGGLPGVWRLGEGVVVLHDDAMWSAVSTPQHGGVRLEFHAKFTLT
jgi:hypothetical protein